jgi:Arc/MetJ-type ribon-helix-helix transcriptional regulator
VSGEKGKGKLRERILGYKKADESDSKKREVHIMTRLTSDTVEIIDTLVELEVFRSKSEAVSVYVEKEIASQMDLYEEVRLLGRKLSEMRESAKKLAFEDKDNSKT